MTKSVNYATVKRLLDQSDIPQNEKQAFAEALSKVTSPQAYQELFLQIKRKCAGTPQHKRQVIGGAK